MKKQSIGCEQINSLRRITSHLHSSGIIQALKIVNFVPLKLMIQIILDSLEFLNRNLPCWQLTSIARLISSFQYLINTSRTLFLECEDSNILSSQYLFSWILYNLFSLLPRQQLISFSPNPSIIIKKDLVWTSMTVLFYISLNKQETFLYFYGLSSYFRMASSYGLMEGYQKDIFKIYSPIQISLQSLSQQRSYSWIALHQVTRPTIPCSLG